MSVNQSGYNFSIDVAKVAGALRQRAVEAVRGGGIVSAIYTRKSLETKKMVQSFSIALQGSRIVRVTIEVIE